jgi:1-acyl-sn-glycerol-3-phosphate acyltransferase
MLRRWGRRLISFPLVAALWGLSVIGLAALPLVALVDLIRGARFAWTRLQFVFLSLLTCELLGLLAAGGIWLARPFTSRAGWLALNGRLQRLWARTLFRALRRIYGVTMEVAGADTLEASGPLIVLARHVSTVDTLLPRLLLDAWNLRYVLKRELLWDPCLDVVGHRLPNVFVRRGSDDASGELRKLSALAEGLGQRDAAVIFPEGTRYTPAKRLMVLKSLARAGNPEAVRQAQELLHVLLPKTGGTRALLSACPEASVLVLSHTGLEGAESLASFASGALIGRRIRVHLERVPAGQVPRDPQAFEAWLWAAWGQVDRWVGQRLPGVAPVGE